MHHGGVFNGLEQIARAFNRLNRVSIAGIHAMIDQSNTMLRAGFHFEQVKSFGRFTTKIDDGFNALFGELRDAFRRRLIFAVHAPANIVAISKTQTQKPVIPPCKVTISLPPVF